MSTPRHPVVLNKNIIEMEYAVRGPIPRRAAELKEQGVKTIPCNIGNPQALGQQPITFYRQVMSLIEEPARINRERRLNSHLQSATIKLDGMKTTDILPDYTLNLAEKILKNMETGMGAYTESAGPGFIRKAIADFIDNRDRQAKVRAW